MPKPPGKSRRTAAVGATPPEPPWRTISHVFVLMLENRSFDHMLALSGLPGIDAATGAQANPGPAASA